MSQKVALIASVLKPVDDTRLYEKLGQTVAQTNKYRVNIIGFASKNIPANNAITFHPIFNFRRLSLARMLAPWKFLSNLGRLRPHLLIVCTPELLIPAVLFKIFHGGRLWYDVQENYQLNVRFQKVYNFWWRPLVPLGLWVVHKLSRPWIDHYLLAEAGYAKEMSFPKGNYTVLANKYQPIDIPHANIPSDSTNFIISGTISELSGVRQTIDLMEAFSRLGHQVKLTIIGHIPDPHLDAELQALNKKPYLQIITNGKPLPHSQIMQHLRQADYGIVAHQPDLSNQNCIPTRIYEFMGLRKPFLLQEHALWESVAKPYDAALVMDFNQLQPQHLWDQLSTQNFYTTTPGEEITWASEAPKLLKLLSD